MYLILLTTYIILHFPINQQYYKYIYLYFFSLNFLHIVFTQSLKKVVNEIKSIKCIQILMAHTQAQTNDISTSV